MQNPAPTEFPPGDRRDVARQAVLRSSILNVSKMTLSMAITMPLGLVTKILVPRIIGSEKAGILYFAESFPLFLLCFMSLGLPSYIQKHVPPRHEHAREIFDSLCAFQALVGAVLVAGLMIYLHLSDYDALTVRVTAIMACYQALVCFCGDILQRMFLALGRVNITATLNVVAKVVSVALVLLCLAVGASIEWLAVAFLVAQIGALVLMLWQAKVGGLMGGGIKLKELKRVVLVSMPFFMAGVLATTNVSIDSLCLSRLASFKELGYYGAAQRLNGVFLMLVPFIGQVFIPTLSRVYTHDRQEYSVMTSNIARALAICAFPLALAFTAFGREIILAVYGQDFQPAILAITVNGPLLMISYLLIFFAHNAMITTNGKSYTAIFLLGSVLNFVFDYVFIRLGLAHFGPGGGAAGATLSSLLIEVLEAVLLLRIIGAKMVNRRAIYTFAVVILPSVGLVLVSDAWYTVGVAWRLGLFVVLLPAYLFATRVVTAADLAAIAAALRRKGLGAHP